MLWSAFPFTTESFFWACPDMKMSDESGADDAGQLKEQADESNAEPLSPLNLEHASSVPAEIDQSNDELIQKVGCVKGLSKASASSQSFGKSLFNN